MTMLRELFESLDRRRRPEDIAELVRQELAPRLAPAQEAVLERAAQGALSRRNCGYSSMSEDFARPVGLAHQVETAFQLFGHVPRPVTTSCVDPVAMRNYVADAGQLIRRRTGQNDFKADRLNREQRCETGLGELSKRQYNKRFRLLTRMERKVATLEREIEKRELSLISKSRLASRLTWEELTADADSACFIAYLTARLNLRSVFTCGQQERAYDEVADMLLARCQRQPSTDWWAIAHVHPDRAVLARLSDDQKGKLLGIWFSVLTRIAGLLRAVWEKSRFDRATMIVRKGDDSTTWNATAGAWNKARESWVALLYALDMDEVLEQMCPGKVLRLMAADVAYWHRAVGGGLEPDTAVWAELPAPWEVFAGEAICTRVDVEAACGRHGVDPVRKSWIAPRPGRTVVAFRPTPELVHGVEVGHPGLALVLRRLGVFSGKHLKSLSP